MFIALALAAAVADSSCRVTLDSLATKVARNYPGVTLELTTANARLRYDSTLASARRAADLAQGDACFKALATVTDFWQDGHLFIFQTTRLDTAETSRRVRSAARLPVSEDTLRARWARPISVRDPVEGIWFSGDLRVAVVPDPAQSVGAFVAVVLRSDTTTWQPGMIRARLQRRPDAGYDVQLLERSHQVRYLDARIHKGLLLRMSPVIWGREAPLAATDAGLLAAVDPRAPTLVWRDSVTAVVSIPSHEYGYQRELRRLVDDNRRRLLAAERLIVDLRGNEGGSSVMTDPLLPFILSPVGTERPARTAPWRPWMLSTPENEAAVRNSVQAGRDTTAQVAALLRRLRGSPGERVRYLEDTELPPPRRQPTTESAPRAVAIVVDRGVVSAGEAFLLDAARSTRVTIYGERTAGVLDYGNVSIVRIRPGETRWFLGYPTVIANDRVPAEGIRGRGIRPDVALDLSRDTDVIGTVIRRMK